MKTKITRRRFIQSAALATSGLTLESNLFAAKTKTASEAFSFVLLGDLHLDKLEHHDLDHLRKSDAKQLPQIERYSRITSEVTPKLFSTLQKTITDLNKNSATHAAFTIQVGDFVEGVCTSPELSKQHFDYALNFVRESKLATPFLFTKGNHEINSPGSINLYQSDFFPFLSEQIRAVTKREENLQKAYFTVSQGNALFIFFDAYDKHDCLDWMESVLAKRTEQHVFVVIHTPVVPYGARAAWHIFASAPEVVRRNRLLNLLGKHKAIVLSGHLHKFSSMVRETKEGNFFQLALHSVISSEDMKSETTLLGVENYTVKQLELESDYHPESKELRRELIEAEKPFVKHFEYTDLPGYAVLTVNKAKVEAKMYSGTNQKLWKTIDISALLAA